MGGIGMEYCFHIGEIARFFDVPASTLRYWQDAGILSPDKNSDNSYREYKMEDFMTLSDVIFYKSLGVSLKQIRNIEKETPEEHEQLFRGKIAELEHRKQQLDRCIEKLKQRLYMIAELKKLERHPYLESDIDTECIVSFDLIEMDKVRQYIENPYLYSRVQHTNCLESEQRGLTLSLKQIDREKEKQILWEKRGHSYVVCLLKEEVTKGYPNNLREHLNHIQKKYKTGYIISRFLLCAQENGKRYDYYKTFVEVE